MARQNPNLLLVEGKDEEFTLPHLMDEYTVWGDREVDWVVKIRQLNGVEQLLKPGVIEAESKTPGIKALGIILDANDSLESRWARVRERCRKIDDSFPEYLPTTGLIHSPSNGLRIGVWIMPDNGARGMLETFLGQLLTPDRKSLWDLARDACDRVGGMDGCYTSAHRDKAIVHTYLAWVEPPGLSLGHSVLKRSFDARLPLALTFANWFMTPFDLPQRPTARP